MRLPNRPSGREPDIVFVLNANRSRVTRTYINGPADLAVETVSPDSEERDRNEKLGEYEAAGVQEYWLIDLLRREAHFYQLGEGGRYRDVLPDAEGMYRSPVLGDFPLRLAWLFTDPLPSLVSVLRELSLV